MPFIPLESVKHRVQVGSPLPFNVRHIDQTLLLARGQIIDSHEQLNILFARGMLVDIAELQSPREKILDTPADQLPALWERSIAQASASLLKLPTEGLDAAVEDIAQPLVALVERDPDLAIFQVLRQHGSTHTQYGVHHSIHSAIATFLAAHRLGWDRPSMQVAFKAALTMNVSTLELQGQLTAQSTALTPKQLDLIHTHPARSMQMLQGAGITDTVWLQGVLQHHETTNGNGYPAGPTAITPLAALLQRCDVYTAKLSPREVREALTADVAARKLFAAYPGDPMSAAVIKEFGLYPPGCFVKLASGEMGMVIKRGKSAHTPQVSVLANAQGKAALEHPRRDTSQPGFGIVAVVGMNTMRPFVNEANLSKMAAMPMEPAPNFSAH
jgi:HD-GYP domain-containing protein (c-di-GMP phosphodiesterase class II)